MADVWTPPRLIRSPWLRYGLLALAAGYVILGFTSIDVRWERVAEGMSRATRFLAAFARPDFASRWTEISEGIAESLTMTVVSTTFGILISIPVGLGAARNISPTPIYLACRGLIAVSRAFQEVIVAIFFVAMFGFGPFAGVLTLTFATMGFLAKLLAEDVEDIDPVQLEAIRATGAVWPQVVSYAIQPQVMPRLIGLSLYRLDINFRESAVIGIVGAGGIGSTLNTSFSRYEYNTSAAVLVTIIVIVLIAENVSALIRRRIQ